MIPKWSATEWVIAVFTVGIMVAAIVGGGDLTASAQQQSDVDLADDIVAALADLELAERRAIDAVKPAETAGLQVKLTTTFYGLPRENCSRLERLQPISCVYEPVRLERIWRRTSLSPR